LQFVGKLGEILDGVDREIQWLDDFFHNDR
jgi:hypothetical protein